MSFGFGFFPGGLLSCVLLSVLAFSSYNLVLQELVSSDQFQVSIFPFAHLVLFDAICMRPFPLAPWAPLHDCDSIDIGSTSVQSVRFWWKKESANSFLVPECSYFTVDIGF